MIEPPVSSSRLVVWIDPATTWLPRMSLNAAEMATADVGPEAVHAHADGRLADEVDREPRFVSSRLERRLLRLRGQSDGFVAQVRGDDALRRGAGRQHAGVPRQAHRRPAGHLRTVVECVDAVTVLLVDAERHARGADGQRRAHRRDSGHAGQQVRDLRGLAAARVDTVHVRNALAIGDEEQRRPVCRPLRINVLAVVETTERAHVAAGDVEQCESGVAGLEARDVAGEAIGAERDRVPVGRPRRVEHFVERFQLDFTLFAAVLDINDRDDRVAAAQARGRRSAARAPALPAAAFDALVLVMSY